VPTAPVAVTLSPLAYVRNRVSRSRTEDWADLDSVLTLSEGQPATLLSGLEGFSHVIVVFFLDRLGEDRPRPATIRVGVDPTPRGVLATRSQLRPNPIGVATVQLLSVNEDSLMVRGLDALDGTPVLDIKPYIPFYDSVPGATVPQWVNSEPSNDT
jgi:tRNA-Thr(GGU) m(6)t(6)A37 methyltransferase TsaA